MDNPKDRDAQRDIKKFGSRRLSQLTVGVPNKCDPLCLTIYHLSTGESHTFTSEVIRTQRVNLTKGHLNVLTGVHTHSPKRVSSFTH